MKIAWDVEDRRIWQNFIIIVIFLLVSIILINYPLGNFQPENVKNVRIANQRIRVELATTPESQTEGLSGRVSLAEDAGMLFVFNRPDKYYFWMKGMNFNIDIIWIGEDMKVAYIKENAKFENFLETYGPDVDTKYVLEVVAGFSEKNGLKVGDNVEFLFY